MSSTTSAPWPSKFRHARNRATSRAATTLAFDLQAPDVGEVAFARARRTRNDGRTNRPIRPAIDERDGGRVRMRNQKIFDAERLAGAAARIPIAAAVSIMVCVMGSAFGRIVAVIDGTVEIGA